MSCRFAGDATTMSTSIDLIALSLLPSSRWRTVFALLRAGASAADILETQCADGARARPSAAWTNADRLRSRAAVGVQRGLSAGLVCVPHDDPRYPSVLADTIDPPPVLWVRGQDAVLSRMAVAIVGSRAGSPYGLGVAERLGADLAAAGLVVVSGLARGVDSAAHRGALSVGGVTVGVLGCGVDQIYPPEHAALADAMTAQGAVVSELLPGTDPRREFFPRRNRIISGLSRAVVVVEAGEKSGSLITARCALEQGRDVLSVPGNVLAGRNRGGHALLRDGARLVESADDIMDELGLRRVSGRPVAVGVVADPVLACLQPGEPADLGQISARSGLSAVELLPRLLALELQRAVRREPGGRFVRLDQSC